MPPVHSARVPYIPQNDGIRCGPAAIQAILYGRDNNDRFNPPASDVLKATVPVHDDQETIWIHVKGMSAAVAEQLHAELGGSEAEQICERLPDGSRVCWTTHPRAMEKLIAAGLDTTTLQLSGVTAAEFRMLPEVKVPHALIESINSGVGAAVLIDGMHWVVAYKSEQRTDGDLDIFFHDPATTARFVWDGVDALLADIIDVDEHAVGAQTAVVGVRSGSPDVIAHLAAPLTAHAARGAARLLQGRARAATFHDLPADFTTTLKQSIQRLEHLDAGLAQAAATRILRVRHERKPIASYFLVEFGGIATVVVDGETHRPRVIASPSESGEPLPRILDREVLAAQLDGRRVETGGAAIVLDQRRFHFEEELAWERCDQSRSMLDPFYVLRQPRAGGAPGNDVRLYVRATDGQVFTKLTRNLRGV